MSRNKNRNGKQNGKGKASVEDVPGRNGGVRKGEKKTGEKVFSGGGSARPPSEEEQMKWACEESKRMYEETLQKTANIDIGEDRDDRPEEDYWNKKQSNLPKPETEKVVDRADPSDAEDDRREKEGATAGRIGDRPPGRSVVGRSNDNGGNVEKRVRRMEEAAAAAVDTDKRFGRGSGPREQQPQRRPTNNRQEREDGREFARRPPQRSDRYHYYTKEERRPPRPIVVESDVDRSPSIERRHKNAEESEALKNYDNPEKKPAEEKLRLTGFHSRSNRPSPDDDDDDDDDGSEKLETRATRDEREMYNPSPALDQPTTIGNLASNPDSQRVYDQLAIHDPLLHRLLVQKHIQDEWLSGRNRPGPAPAPDSDNHCHYRRQAEQEEDQRQEQEGEEEEEEARGEMPEEPSNFYRESAPPGTVYVIVPITYDGDPARIIGPMSALSLPAPNDICHRPREPPFVDENYSGENGGGMSRPRPRGTAPSHRIPEFVIPYQSPLGPRFFANPHENLALPEYSLPPVSPYGRANSRLPVAPGLPHHSPYTSGNGPNLAPVFPAAEPERYPPPPPPRHYNHDHRRHQGGGHFTQRNFDNLRNFSAPRAGRDSRQQAQQPRPEPPPMPNYVQTLPR